MIDKFEGEYNFLSNFHPAIIEYESRTWATVEHAYQAAKTDNKFEKEMIRKEPYPGGATRIGKTVCINDNWDYIRVDIMKELLKLKFAIPELRDKLIATGDEELIEGNTWKDNFWGVYKGDGKNYLGRLLMEIRGELRRDTVQDAFAVVNEKHKVVFAKLGDL